MNEKRLLPNNFTNTTDTERNEIFISNKISTSSDVNFLSACIYDTNIPYLSASLSSSNVVNTLSNSATLISYTGLYNHVNSYLYLNDNVVKSKIDNFDGLSSAYVRVITLPMYSHDYIEPGSLNLILDSNQAQYSKFLKLTNNKDYDYGQNCSFVYFNDEDWLLKKCSNLSNEYTINITFKLNSGFINDQLTTNVGYLFYRPNARPRQEIAYGWEADSICSTGIPFGGGYETQYNTKFDKNYIDSNSIENGIAARLIYYSLSSNNSFSGQYMFLMTLNGIDIRFPAIYSSATSNSQSGSFSSLTSEKNLLDGNFHQLTITRKNLSGLGISLSTIMNAYLDGVKLSPIYSGTNDFYPTVFDCEYSFGNTIKHITTPIFLGAKINPINQQVTNYSLRIANDYLDSKFNKYRFQNIEPEINPNINSVTSVLNWTNRISSTGSNTNMYSNFGAVNNRLFLKNYYGIIDDNLNTDLNYDEHELNKLNVSNSITNFGIMGFNGLISNFYLYDKRFEDLDYENGITAEPLSCVNLSGSFSATLAYRQKNYIYPITTNGLIGDFRFFDEDSESVIVKNSIYDNSKHNYFKGCGIFINHKDFKNDKTIPNCKIENTYELYDIYEKVYSNNLRHGKLFFNGANKKECGTIFYDLGIMVIDTNFDYPFYMDSTINDGLDQVTKSFLNSFTAGSSATFNNSSTSNIIVKSINYKLVKNNYNNYITLPVNSYEFNISKNITYKDGISIYPTTFGLYNDNNEILFIAKYNGKNEKNKFVDSKYTLKINYK